jgi:hypothetical protein
MVSLLLGQVLFRYDYLGRPDGTICCMVCPCPLGLFNQETKAHSGKQVLQQQHPFAHRSCYVVTTTPSYLPRIWGFCSRWKHKLLVYEYVENESLDENLFDTTNKEQSLDGEQLDLREIVQILEQAVASGSEILHMGQQKRAN